MDTLHFLGFTDWLENPEQGFIPNPARLLVEHAAAFRERVLELSGAEDLVTGILPVPVSGGTRENFEIYQNALKPMLDRVGPADVVLGFGQHLPIRDILALETHFDGVFKGFADGQHLSLSPNGMDLSEKLADVFRTAIEQGKMSGVALTADAGTFYCSALGHELAERFPGRGLFFHLHSLATLNDAQVDWQVYEGLYRKKGLQGPENLAVVSTEENFERLCGVLRVLRSF